MSSKTAASKSQNIKLNRGIKIMTPFQKHTNHHNGVIIIDLKPEVTPDQIKSHLPHCISVEIDPRLGTLNNDQHHAFVAKFEDSKHKPDNELMSLPIELFNSDMIIFGYIEENIEISINDLVKQRYGKDLMLLGYVSKDITSEQLHTLLPTSNCIYEIHSNEIQDENKKLFVVSTLSLQNFYLQVNTIPESYFTGKRFYSPIEESVEMAVARLKPYLDGTNQKEKTKHKKGPIRFLVTNLPEGVDDKALFRSLPHCGSVELTESGNAYIIDFPTLFDEIELQELRHTIGSFDYTIIKRTPSASLKVIQRFKTFSKTDEEEE